IDADIVRHGSDHAPLDGGVSVKRISWRGICWVGSGIQEYTLSRGRGIPPIQFVFSNGVDNIFKPGVVDLAGICCQCPRIRELVIDIPDGFIGWSPAFCSD